MAKNGKTGDGKKGAKKGERETLHVALLVDESGSMAHLHDAVIGGVNEFISEMKADPSPNTRTLASLAMFDARGGEPPVRVKFSDVPLGKVRPIGPSDYAPHGATPLNDAVARTIRALEKLARPKGKSGKGGKADRVMIVVLTDGLENASETSSEKLGKLILAKEAEGWEFLYLGANQDTWAATAGIGLDRRGKHMAWDASPAGVGRRCGSGASGRSGSATHRPSTWPSPRCSTTASSPATRRLASSRRPSAAAHGGADGVRSRLRAATERRGWGRPGDSAGPVLVLRSRRTFVTDSVQKRHSAFPTRDATSSRLTA